MSGDPLDVNRAHWDSLATVHGQDAVYDSEALVGGRDSLSDHEDAAISAAAPDLRGVEVLHLQCHIGFDTVSLARRGASVTGVDFSAVSLAKARDLAARCGVDVELVEAEATALPPELYGRFDVVYATVGVLNWIEDVEAWMRSARAALRPGGRLVLVELHPLYVAIGSLDPLVLDFPYAFDGARRFDEQGSYADPDAHVESSASVEFAHSLGEVATAAVGAGLRVDLLREHLDYHFDPRGDLLARDEDGRFRLRIGGQELPILYTLLATAKG